MSINNTPEIGPYTELKPFRFWCQKVLPITYDDSLSYYELLCKVVDYLNKTMEDVDNVVSDMGDFKTAYEELIAYVNGYFDSLDITTEINNKLDEMAQDGTLTLLVKPFFDEAIADVPDVVTTWLAAHVDPDTGYVIDNTLSITDAAADAKATGDAIKNVISDMATITGNEKIGASAWVSPYAYRTGSGDTITVGSPNLNSQKRCTYLAANPGDKFTLFSTVAGTNNYADYAFVNSAGGIIAKGNGPYTGKVITAPAGTVYVVFNAALNETDYPAFVFKGEIVINQLNDLQSEVDAIKTALDAGLLKKEPFELQFVNDHYWNDETDTVVDTAYANYEGFNPIAVTPGQQIYIYILYPHSTKTHAAIFVDDDLTVVERWVATRDAYQSAILTVPAGATKLLLSTTAGGVQATECGLLVPGEFDPNYKNTFKGKKLSLLGDSFSAMDDYSTDSHNYYPNPNSNVQLYCQMWWWQVAEALGMEPLVIGAWSGSCVASGIRDDSSYKPASDPDRCEALDDGVDDPDVILIAMGVNDYSYSANAAQFVEWDGTTALGSQADLSDYITTDFERAYATMLARIQKAYPDAFIVCITPFFMCRYATDTGANYLNSIGKSVFDYEKAVKKIASIMHVAVIDGTNIGFNRYNYYPDYAEDSNVKPTHPTIKGQKAIADAVIAQLSGLRKI